MGHTTVYEMLPIDLYKEEKALRALVSTIVILHKTTPLNYIGWYKNRCKAYLYWLQIEVILPYKSAKNRAESSAQPN